MNQNAKNARPQKVRIPLLGNRNEGLPTRPMVAARGQSRLREKEEYGIVVNLRDTFGFVQSIFADEQLYLPEREFYDNIKVGDRVAYIGHEGHKGRYGDAVRFLVPALERVVQGVQGVVKRLPERHKSLLGVVEIDASKLEPDVAAQFSSPFACKVLFRPTDVAASSLPRANFLDVGDLVELAISRQHDSGMMVATEVKFVQSRRDRESALQVQRMLDAGAVREIGVVTTVRNGEYGFIQVQDRQDEVYFKMDDVIGVPAGESIKEGSELEFFVITEIVKGKTSNRAFHLKPIAPGTVQLEVIVGVQLEATVAAEPSSSDESPGTAVLTQPIDLSSFNLSCQAKSISQIDLWARCLPDEMACRVGDKLQLNAHYYRPEKLFFAREVRLKQFYPLGRDSGVICGLRENFGFITSDRRRTDLYFKSSLVVDSEGNPFPAQQLKLGLPVEFDVSLENGKQLRAVRVQVPSKESLKARAKEDREKYTLKKDVLGIVARNTAKKDTLGLIKLANPNEWLELHEADFVDPELYHELQALDTDPLLKSIEQYALPASLRRKYAELVSKYFDNLQWEEIPVGQAQGGTIALLKITKINPSSSSSNTGKTDQKTAPAGENERRNKLLANQQREGSTLQFMREDYVSADLGMLQNDLEVVFDVCYDKFRSKLAAKRIRLTDEPVDSTAGEKVGIVEVVIDKGDKFGFVRCIPEDEKLLWQAIGSNAAAADIEQGRAVAFELRRRGGLRMAVNLRQLGGEELLAMFSKLNGLLASGRITALVVENNKAVLVDTESNAVLQNRLLPIGLLVKAFSQTAKLSKTGNWAKQSLGKGESSEATGSSEPSNSNASTPPPGAEAVLTGNCDGAAEDKDEHGRVSYQPKYFSATHRMLVAVQQDNQDRQGDESSPATAPAVKAGDYIECAAEVNWAQQLLVTSVTPKSVLSQGQKRQGQITKLKVKPSSVKDALAGISAERRLLHFVGNAEMMEISYTENDKVVHCYCLSNEIITASNENSRDAVQLNDQIEFWTLPEMEGYAFAPTLVGKPTSRDVEELNFGSKRTGFNTELKEQMSKVGTVNLITMAKGPPKDDECGFEPGWREIDKEQIAQLPWASLLPHLLE